MIQDLSISIAFVILILIVALALIMFATIVFDGARFR